MFIAGYVGPSEKKLFKIIFVTLVTLAKFIDMY